MKTYLFRKVTKTPEGQAEDIRASHATDINEARRKANVDNTWESAAAGEMCACFRIETQGDVKIDERVKALAFMLEENETDDDFDMAMDSYGFEGLDTCQINTLRTFITNLVKP